MTSTHRLETAGTVLTLALAALFVAVASLRLATPFDLEWMEGGMAMHAVRLAEGLSLYTAPDLGWAPFIYPPLYPALVAVLIEIGIDAWSAARVLSLLSTLGCAALLFGVVRGRTGDARLGLTGGALFLATFPLSGFWFDLARVDSLSLFLMLAGVALLARKHSRNAGAEVALGAAAALLMASSVLTKQTALPIALVVPVALWPGRPWRLASYGAGFLASLGAAVGWLQSTSGGWFWTYVVRLPAAHAAPPARAVAALGEMVRDLPLAALVLVAAPLLAASGQFRRSAWHRVSDPWILTGIAAVLSSAWARAHAGSFDNVLMPAHWYGVLAIALASGARDIAPAMRRVLAAAILLQAGLCLYDPRGVVPSADDRRAAARLVELMSTAPAAVFFPDRPFAVAESGHPPHAHSMALNDVARAGLPDVPAVDLDRAYRERRFAAVIVRPLAVTPALDENYLPAPRLTEAIRAAPFPRTGWYSRQLVAFRPRQPEDATVP